MLKEIDGDTLEDLSIPYSPEGFEFVAKQDMGMDRWNANYMIVFQHEGQLYGVHYEEGLTENQQFDYAHEYAPHKVFPVVGKEVTHIEYSKEAK